MLQERLKKQVPAWALIAVAVGMLVLFAAGSGLYNSGWSDGLTFGLLSGGGDGGKLLAYQGYAAQYSGAHGWGHAGMIGGFLGGIFRFFFFLFFLGMIFKFFGFLRWRMHGGQHGFAEHGSGGHHQAWGGPPWMHGQHHGQQQGQQSQPKPAEGQSAAAATAQKPQNTSWIV